MATKSLAGKRVAVIVESQYIPGEIRVYQEQFAAHGAQVDLVSRLWGQPSQRFYSTVEPEGGVVPPLEWLDVSLDVDRVNLDDYAAVIMAANYTSVRLRYSERRDINAGNAAEVARSVPAVRFFRRAMENPDIVKGAPCHALWLVTPSPDLLAGRRVICNPVVLADVVNTGALYVPCVDDQVVVDRDLVTNTGWHASRQLVDKIAELISQPRPAPVQTPAPRATPGKRRILIVLSGWGYWGEELVGPLGEFDRVGYDVDFCTPERPPPECDPGQHGPGLLRPAAAAAGDDAGYGGPGARDRRSDHAAGHAAWRTRSAWLGGSPSAPTSRPRHSCAGSRPTTAPWSRPSSGSPRTTPC